MDKNLILPRVITQSRRRIAQSAGNYYEFTEQELLIYTENIIKECIAIADYNHQSYKEVGEALCNVMLKNTGDVIREHFDIKE